MIIERLISYISDDIKALNYGEVYGGVARTQRVKEFEDAKLGVTIYKKFPISCAISGDVEPNKTVQRFRDLIPNDGKKSILYWEVLQGMKDVGGFAPNTKNAPNEQVRVMRGRARLVGWLNLKRLGVSNCNSAADAIFPLLPIVTQQKAYPAIPLQNTKVRYRLDNIVPRDISIFSKYTYDPLEYTFTYPFDYFAMDISIELILPLGCVPQFPISNEITCVDYTVVS